MNKINTSEKRPIREAIEEFLYRIIRCSDSRLIKMLYNIISSIPFIIKCYSQILWLPKIIEGYQLKLSAQKQLLKHYKEIAEYKTLQVEDIISEEIAADASAKDKKKIYQRWDLLVPSKYLTNEEIWDIAEKNHEDWLGSGGIGDLDHIYRSEQEGNKLLRGFDDTRI